MDVVDSSFSPVAGRSLNFREIKSDTKVGRCRLNSSNFFFNNLNTFYLHLLTTCNLKMVVCFQFSVKCSFILNNQTRLLLLLFSVSSKYPDYPFRAEPLKCYGTVSELSHLWTLRCFDSTACLQSETEAQDVYILCMAWRGTVSTGPEPCVTCYRTRQCRVKPVHVR